MDDLMPELGTLRLLRAEAERVFDRQYTDEDSDIVELEIETELDFDQPQWSDHDE